MKHLSYLSRLIGLSSLWLMGCSAFLEFEPEDILSNEMAFENLDRAQESLNGVYALLDGYANSTLFRRSIPLLNELLSGNVSYLNYSEGSSQYQWIYNLEYDPNSVGFIDGVYSTGYRLINALNLIIENVPKVDGEEAQRNQILAEAFGLRAFVYFKLVQLYSPPYQPATASDRLGLVLLTSPIRVQEAAPGRSSLLATFQLIQQDLERSRELFASGKAGEFNQDPVYLSYPALLLVQAKSYLYIQQADSALSVLTEYETNRFAQPYDSAFYFESFLDEQTNHSDAHWNLDIWTQNNVATLYNELSLEALLTSNTALFEDENVLRASGDLVQLYQEMDPRLQLFSDTFHITTDPANLVSDTLNYYFTKKYASEETHLPIVRSSEFELLKAEALLELDRLAEARQVLKDFQLRYGIDYELDSLETPEALRTALYQERRREFAFEGHSFFDSKRLGLDIRRTDCEGNACMFSISSNQATLPIPIRSVLGNPKIVQNDGYQ